MLSVFDAFATVLLMHPLTRQRTNGGGINLLHYRHCPLPLCTLSAVFLGLTFSGPFNSEISISIVRLRHDWMEGVSKSLSS